MSNLIKASPMNPSIKSIDFGGVRLTAYEELCKYRILVSTSSDGVHFKQVTSVIPSTLQHIIEPAPKGQVVALIRDPLSGLCLTLDCELDYMAVCELFSMPLDTSVFQALLECDVVTSVKSEA